MFREILVGLPRQFVVSFFVISALFAYSAQAADDLVMLEVQQAMQTPDAKAKLDTSISYYFGKTGHPQVLEKFGPAVTNKKTNAFGKSDFETCSWVFLSALLSLQDRVRAVGGNAVVNIRSYYKKNEVSNDTHVECHRGFLISGVALIGDVVKVAK